ncbi:MAG: helix-turn-helix domain-containing protein [Stellaceae bacterium]
MKSGPPLTFTPEIGEEICSLVAEGGLGLTDAAAKLGLSRRTVRSWIERNADFAAAFEIASRLRVDAMVDEMVALSDAAAGLDAAGVQAARLAVDTRRWLAAKLLPGRYGDRVELTGAGGKDLIPEDRGNACRGL